MRRLVVVGQPVGSHLNNEIQRARTSACVSGDPLATQPKRPSYFIDPCAFAWIASLEYYN